MPVILFLFSTHKPNCAQIHNNNNNDDDNDVCKLFARFESLGCLKVDASCKFKLPRHLEVDTLSAKVYSDVLLKDSRRFDVTTSFITLFVRNLQTLFSRLIGIDLYSRTKEIN